MIRIMRTHKTESSNSGNSLHLGGRRPPHNIVLELAQVKNIESQILSLDAMQHHIGLLGWTQAFVDTWRTYVLLHAGCTKLVNIL